MEITNKRIDAKPRSKYKRYYGSGIVVNGSSSTGGGGSTVDLSNFVKLSGETSQTIEGNVLATGDLVAYATSEHDIELPIATTGSSGTVIVGSGLTINDEGVLSVTGSTGGGVSSWDDLTDKPSVFPTNWENVSGKPESFPPSEHTHVMADITDFNGVTIDTDQTITGKKTFTQTITSYQDVVAYATGLTEEDFPIAGTATLGCIKVGEGLAVTDDGTVYITGGTGGGTVSEWGDITGSLSNQTDLWNALNNKANTSDLHSHSNKSTLDGISSTNVSNWNTAYSRSHTHSNKSVLDGITSSDVSYWDTAYSRSHTHSNKSILDDIDSTDISHWNTGYNNAHWHNNKSYLDNINQNLSTSSAPRFQDLTIGSTSNVQTVLGAGSGNCINGITAAGGAGNLYLNWWDSSSYVKVDANNNLTATGDIIAYSTGNATSNFPIATRNSIGCVKIGSGLNVTSDGTISVTGGTSSGGSNVSWGTTTSNYAALSVNGSSKNVSLNGHTHSGYASSSHSHSQYITGITSSTSGSGNAVTGITASGNKITVYKGNISGGSGSWNGGTVTNNINIQKSGAVLQLTGNNGTWQAAQIQFTNSYYSTYGYRWCIETGGSQIGVGDLVYNSYNSSGTGSANASPWFRIKVRRYSMSDALQGAGAYTNASDSRLKNLNRPYHNPISTLSNEEEEDNSILNKIANLNSYYFNWKLPNEMKANSVSEEEETELKETEYFKREILGFVAQDLKQVFPEFVYGQETENEYLTIDYAGLGAVVAIEGLKEVNNKLENKVTELNDKINQLENMITQLTETVNELKGGNE